MTEGSVVTHMRFFIEKKGKKMVFPPLLMARLGGGGAKHRDTAAQIAQFSEDNQRANTHAHTHTLLVDRCVAQ